MMTPERWQQVKGILDQALELRPEQRSGFLDRACSNDDSLRHEVKSLLEVQGNAEGFLEAATNTTRVGQSSGYLMMGDVGAGRVDLQLVRGSTSDQSLEIRDLLRRRLQIIALLALSGQSVFYAGRFVRLEFTPTIIWYTMVPGAANLLVLVVLTAILWQKRFYPLEWLRRLEMALFGWETLFFLSDTYAPLFLAPAWLLTYAQRHADEISILVRQPSIYWLVLIVSYGMFIPNTGRRCAAVTGAIGLSPMIMIASAGFLHPEIPRKALALFLTEMAFWMSIAVAMAIYGSHKITVLRQEAFAARKLGQYELKQRLGQGGMGEVYLAEHALLKRPCAIKVIRPDQADNPATLQRFLREVQATATLTHPNTVQIFDYGQADDGTVFYAMEYLPGINLQELVEQYGPVNPRRAVHILHQLCAALAEAHAVGLIHRDIKPSNVILCNRGGLYDVAKLLDFGLVRLQSAEQAHPNFTQGGLIFGTPAYMSPEQASGKLELDARSDLYSLGAVAWFLALGEPPFVRDSVVQTLAAHISEPAQSLRSRSPEYPEDLAEIVQRCLAKNPDNRFPDVTSLEASLAKCRLEGAWTQREAVAWWNSHADVVSGK